MHEITPKDLLPIIQSIGIIAGLVYAGLNFRREGKAKRASNYVTLVQNYRDIWKLKITDPALSDALKQRVAPGIEATEQQKQFITFLFFHLSTYFYLRQNDQIDEISAISIDVKNFLSSPLVKCHWEENKSFYNDDFIRFVDGC